MPNLDQDISFNKDTPFRKLGEGGAIQFRAEFFNIFNHPNFGMPSGPIYGGTLPAGTPAGTPVAYTNTPLSTAGNISYTVTTSRQIQLSLKLIF